ncbi:hypothetical protein ACSFA0_26160 [Variovorax sp. LT1P1]|uniref:hypothetical protein n=1 Tax=Variovorax sp. LT1P1 TaxID=3443730 RepID=UPI003F46BF9C
MKFQLAFVDGVEPAFGVYAHGLAEGLCASRLSREAIAAGAASDLIGIVGGNIECQAVGRHACSLYDVAATLFLWRRRHLARGYVVLDDDLQGLAFAASEMGKGAPLI